MLLPEDWILGLLASLTLTVGSLLTRKIDFKGAIAGGCIVFAMFLGSGWLGILALFVFFTAGTFVSQVKKKQKQALQLAQENEGKRTIINAISNGGMAGVCGIFAWLSLDNQLLWEVAMLASIASACSDTFSSELGNVYGKRYVSILTFKKDKRGLDGVVSLEGLLAGVLGSFLIAILFGIFRNFGLSFFAIFIIGILGNLSDSVYGATLQRNGSLNNHQVNLLSTFTAGILAILLMAFL